MGGMNDESSAKGLIVNINLPHCWPVIINERTDGLVAFATTRADVIPAVPSQQIEWSG
jgi:hypothetical protein